MYNSLVSHFERDAENPKEQTVFIGHADNKEGALELQKRIKGMCKKSIICDIGPVYRFSCRFRHACYSFSSAQEI